MTGRTHSCGTLAQLTLSHSKSEQYIYICGVSDLSAIVSSPAVTDRPFRMQIEKFIFGPFPVVGRPLDRSVNVTLPRPETYCRSELDTSLWLGSCQIWTPWESDILDCSVHLRRSGFLTGESLPHDCLIPMTCMTPGISCSHNAKVVQDKLQEHCFLFSPS